VREWCWAGRRGVGAPSERESSLGGATGGRPGPDGGEPSTADGKMHHFDREDDSLIVILVGRSLCLGPCISLIATHFLSSRHHRQQPVANLIPAGLLFESLSTSSRAQFISLAALSALRSWITSKSPPAGQFFCADNTALLASWPRNVNARKNVALYGLHFVRINEHVWRAEVSVTLLNKFLCQLWSINVIFKAMKKEKGKIAKGPRQRCIMVGPSTLFFLGTWL